MPRRKLSEDEKKLVWKKKIYTKLMNHETLNITEVAKLLNKKAGTIRSWELKGLIPKPNKDEETDRRVYTINDLYVMLKSLMEHEWERNCLNREEVQTVLNYVQSIVSIETTQRTVKKDAYAFDGKIY